ncbi:hypothetical protein ABT354_32950 [Streptomyces sp. NPDC000594]|uniref:hypothetical protein n=1 Tax=Streptomyces sp. NPDC000594 TaxID=3154261 RepID=UPI003330AC82
MGKVAIGPGTCAAGVNPEAVRGRVRNNLQVIVMQPVLETHPSDFDLWPVAGVDRHGYLTLSGELGPAEIGTAVMGIAACNDIDPVQDDRPPRPADPLGSFLHGLLTFDAPFAAGGMRVTDRRKGIVFLPGCCNGLEEWRAWSDVTDGIGHASFGHDPDPMAERVGDTVRLTVDVEQRDSPVIELSVRELRDLMDSAERDLTRFLSVASDWVAQHLPHHITPVTSALAHALAMPVTAVLDQP